MSWLRRRRTQTVPPVLAVEPVFTVIPQARVLHELSLESVSVVDATQMPSDSPFGVFGDHPELAQWVHCRPGSSDQMHGLPVRVCRCEGIGRGHDHLVPA